MTNQTFQDKIICGDNLSVMSDMPDGCVDLVVTSPPYDDLRTYHGYTLDVPAMITHLWRIMKPGGVIVWVVGDATVNGSETGTSFRQALMFMDAGFKLHDTMIYKKGGQGAVGSRLCYWQEFEYMFVFSKGRPSAIHLIRDRRNVRPGTRCDVQGHRKKDGSKKDKRQITYPEIGIRFNIWQYNSNIRPDHPAVFPEQLAADHIISWSNEGDLIFDPMCGSGTTLKMAERLNRRWLGCDVSEEYCEISRERIRIEQAQLKLDLGGAE